LIAKLLSIVFLLSCFSCESSSQYIPKNGDIIFHTSKSTQSLAIQLATKSVYSHVGIVFIQNGSPFVLEAVQPVKYTPLKKWTERGKDNHFVVKRLKNANDILTSDTLLKMHTIGKKMLGKNYDLYFEWTNNRIYCSELVWKIFKNGAGIEVGELEKMASFDLTNEVIKNKIKERYGTKIPLDETVISPASIFSSKNLETIYQN